MRKIVYATAVAIGVWLILEIVTFTLLSVAESAPATPVFFARQRGRAGSTPTAEEMLNTIQESGKQVLHPYLGFVRNPEREGERHVSRLGFHRTHGELSASASGNLQEVRCADPKVTSVGMFGGSVALMFSQLGSERLLRELDGEDQWNGGCLRSFALAGYKQPQQLQALAYLLSLGEDIDVVLNIDGFNEVTLPYAENVPLGVFYAYPRSWPLLIQSVLDPAEQNLRGEAVYLRRVRGDRDAMFSRRPFSYSALWNFVWRFQDRRLAADIARLEAAYLEHGRGDGGYAAHGPPQAFASQDELFAQLAALWERSSLAMHQLCTARGIPYYHVLQPNQYVPGSKLLTAQEQKTAFKPTSTYKTAVEHGYPYLREAGKRLISSGVQFYDLTDVFAAVDETLYVDSCCHFNARGSEIVAVELSRRIRADLRTRAPID